jgi:hypothetical protein
MPPVFEALFLDVPFLVDSAWRHLEFHSNSECNITPWPAGQPRLRAFWRKPPFALFVLTVLFVSYGPTWSGLCSIAPAQVTDFIQRAIGFVIGFCAFVVLLPYLLRGSEKALNARFEWVREHLPEGRTLSPWRRRTANAVTILFALAVATIGVWIGAFLLHPWDLGEPSTCAIANGNGRSVMRLVVCIAAIGLFALITLSDSVKASMLTQALILAAVTIVQWTWLSSDDSTEASHLPYRHVFGVVAPLLCLVIAAAPWIAELFFRSCVQPVGNPTATRLRTALANTEFFVNRDEPTLSGMRIINAVVYGVANNPVQFLLLPALVALVAPADWLRLDVGIAAVVSFMLLAWGNIYDRWHQLNAFIERLFLSGTPLVVSLFVILVAALRLFRVDYVATILDAAPFGATFGAVLMMYILFWLMEYWLNRAVARPLLDVLGPTVSQAYVPYPLANNFARDLDDIRVNTVGQFLATHGTGRFAAVGAIHGSDPTAPAFQTYSFADLFTKLGRQPDAGAAANDVAQRTNAYFLLFNALIIAVIAGFGWFFYDEKYRNPSAARPVVEAETSPPSGPLVDLAALLQRQAQNKRPAIVVVASGGGTRAALYTASVLRGLHRLGADKDIVLASGVSGGGAALAYFAANQVALTAAKQNSARTNCFAKSGATPSQLPEWDCFSEKVTNAFIQDVLNGATEWRIFRSTSLGQLLGESFRRQLFGGDPTFASVSMPALILNSAIVGHPSEDSDVLKETIDAADDADSTCDERERPYSLMNGGRLIFTNLKDADQAFPARNSPVPDVRLPYQIVSDPTVALAPAAAMNANFPPVFPNARVRVKDRSGTRCDHRSFYVTDGGAEENLGLISALYALRHAIKAYPAAEPLPRILVIVAEASAVTYDYTQDHGISAAVSGSRERLTGGLTNELLRELDHPEQLGRKPTDVTRPHLHYLALPLAFRARGGFGTHWMYAEKFVLHDPRPRTPDWYEFLKWSLFSETMATLSRQDLELLWAALHDPDRPFCNYGFKHADAKKVRDWVCGAAGDKRGVRDLHIDAWQHLVDELR